MHNSFEYDNLLGRPEWKRKRAQIIKRDDNKCRNCGCEEHLHVHHRQYRIYKSIGEFVQPWNYPSETLLTLCTDCHAKGHEIYKIPIINI